MANNDSSTQHAVDTRALLDRAQRYCATAEHCSVEVEQLLLRHGAESEQIRKIIDSLTAHDYLNPARYCHAFVHDKVAFQSWGRNKIRMALAAKRLPDELIQAALQDIDEDTYAANMRKLLRTKHTDDKQKLLRFMLQRGYTFDDLRELTDE